MARAISRSDSMAPPFSRLFLRWIDRKICNFLRIKSRRIKYAYSNHTNKFEYAYFAYTDCEKGSIIERFLKYGSFMLLFGKYGIEGIYFLAYL